MLTACGLPSALGGGEGGTDGSRDTPREPPTELHPGLRDCAPQGSNDSLSLADSDLEAVTWSTPAGFYDVSSYYHEDNPVEDIGWIWVAAPESLPNRTLDVISVNYYTGVGWNEHTDNCDAVPLEAVKERLSRYRTQIGAKELSEAEDRKSTRLNSSHVVPYTTLFRSRQSRGRHRLDLGGGAGIAPESHPRRHQRELLHGCGVERAHRQL